MKWCTSDLTLVKAINLRKMIAQLQKKENKKWFEGQKLRWEIKTSKGIWYLWLNWTLIVFPHISAAQSKFDEFWLYLFCFFFDGLYIWFLLFFIINRHFVIFLINEMCKFFFELFWGKKKSNHQMVHVISNYVAVLWHDRLRNTLSVAYGKESA